MSSARYMTLSQRANRVALRLFVVLFCLFLIGPIIAFLPMSVNKVALLHYPIEHVSLRWFEDLIASREWSRAFMNSLLIAFGSSLAATVLGVCAALGLWRARFPGKSMIMVVLMTPMVVPSVIGAVSMYLAFVQFGLGYTYTGLILAHTSLAAPIVVVTVLSALARFEGNLLRAASNLGANPFFAFRRVTFPLILPGILSGAIFAFAISLDDVVVVLFLAGPDQRTIPVQMYMRTGDLFDLVIAAAATVMFVAAVLMMIVLAIVRKKDVLSSGQPSTD